MGYQCILDLLSAISMHVSFPKSHIARLSVLDFVAAVRQKSRMESLGSRLHYAYTKCTMCYHTLIATFPLQVSFLFFYFFY